jgi:hypothetical protein
MRVVIRWCVHNRIFNVNFDAKLKKKKNTSYYPYIDRLIIRFLTDTSFYAIKSRIAAKNLLYHLYSNYQ